MAKSFTSSLTGGLIGNTPDYGKQMEREERRRQALINAGLSNIDAVFGGGTTTVYSPSEGKFDRAGAYYRPDDAGLFQPWSPRGEAGSMKTGTFMRTGLPLFGEGASPKDVYKKAQRRGMVFTGTPTTYTGFGPNFYAQRAQDYIDFAMPQVGQQFRDTQNAVMYGLANRGILGGSADRTASRNLNRALFSAERQVEDTGLAQADDLRDRVEATRQTLKNQLYQSADPAGGTSAAIEAVSRFQRPSSFVPISNMFSNLLNQYATTRLLSDYRSGGLYPTDDFNYDASAALPSY